MGLPSRGFCIYSNRLPENGLGVVLSQLGFGPQFRAGVSSLTGPRASTSHKRSFLSSFPGRPPEADRLRASTGRKPDQNQNGQNHLGKTFLH